MKNFRLVLQRFPLSNEASEALRLGIPHAEVRQSAITSVPSADPFSHYRSISAMFGRGGYNTVLQAVGRSTLQEIGRLAYHPGTALAEGETPAERILLFLDRMPQLQYLSREGRRQIADLLQFPAVWKQVIVSAEAGTPAEEARFRSVRKNLVQGNYEPVLKFAGLERYADLMKVAESASRSPEGEILLPPEILKEFPSLNELSLQQRQQLAELFHYPVLLQAAAAGLLAGRDHVTLKIPFAGRGIPRQMALALYTVGVLAALVVNTDRFVGEGGSLLSLQVLKPLILAFVWPVAGFYR